MSETPVSAREPVRTLPAQPSLEFERKHAKALLRALRAGNADAVARAEHLRETAPDSKGWTLSDAQRIVAREYGFASWPKLVRWFEALVRQSAHGPNNGTFSREYYVQRVDGLLRDFPSRSEWVARVFTSYVPRWFGVPLDAVWSVTPTRAEAELAVARLSSFASWDALMANAGEETSRERDPWTLTPLQLASDAMKRGDLDALEQLTTVHPELLIDNERNIKRGDHLMRTALYVEREQGREAMQPIMAWLASRGFDRQRALDLQFTTPFGQHMIDDALAQGANPNAVLPNGIPPLEHALVGMWSREAVDKVAARATPREALWIAAGLGDIAGMARMFDVRGKLPPAARAIRPHFDAVFSGGGGSPHPDPSDAELLTEALIVAAMNDRDESVRYLASRGAPLDGAWWGMTALGVATGNRRVRACEALLAVGADPDAIAMQSSTARDLAKQVWLDSAPRSDTQRHIAELFGWDPDALLAERRAAIPEPPFGRNATAAIARARHDAARQRAKSVQPLHLFIAAMTTFWSQVLLHDGKVDRERFVAQYGARIARPATLEGASLPLHARAEALLRAVQKRAGDDARQSVDDDRVLLALLDDRDVLRLLRKFDTDVDAMRKAVSRSV